MIVNLEPRRIYSVTKRVLLQVKCLNGARKEDYCMYVIVYRSIGDVKDVRDKI